MYVHCTLYTIHCTLYGVHCTVYTVHGIYTAQLYSPLLLLPNSSPIVCQLFLKIVLHCAFGEDDDQFDQRGSPLGLKAALSYWENPFLVGGGFHLRNYGIWSLSQLILHKLHQIKTCQAPYEIKCHWTTFCVDLNSDQKVCSCAAPLSL